eukprot:CAMPEP_0115012846 /NCGR_PEP_ID=MMETSP0216-20121206/25006_1 /TAXON_ID=223996 /ORGANISM="Protocruzia adherens, Strain Boccale" /LENGTH=704 /DNA_ID=CAMNT_0002382033 /DNA_START=210 /DNA_END=2324 /DNA_ORIENTATION=-
MSMFRSQSIGLYKLIITRENAKEVIGELGKVGCLEFLDLNEKTPDYRRGSSSYLKYCDENQRRLRFLEEVCHQFNHPLTPANNPALLQQALENLLAERDIDSDTYLKQVDQDLERLEEVLTEQSDSFYKGQERIQKLKEHLLVLDQAQQFGRAMEEAAHNQSGSFSFSKASGPTGSFAISEPRVEEHGGGLHVGGHLSLNLTMPMIQDIQTVSAARSISIIYGVLPRVHSDRLRRMIFRATRGNSLVMLEDIGLKMKLHGDSLCEASLVIIAYPGSSESSFGKTICNIVDGLEGHRYDVPKEHVDIVDLETDINQSYHDLIEIQKLTQARIQGKLAEYSTCRSSVLPSYSEELKWFFHRERLIFLTLDKCQAISDDENFLHAYCWCPVQRDLEVFEKIHLIKHRVPDVLCQFLPVNEERFGSPPTFIPTNEFTGMFQEIVNAYSIPKYQEANPAYFTIVTFPFLFGVMYGDVGHGSLLFLFGLYLMRRGKPTENDREIFQFLGKSRYLITMMGFFAIFCGFIYNDFFSMHMPLFSSCYNEKITEVSHSNKVSNLVPLRRTQDCVYPFGIDPIWGHAKNGLEFQNSFKMKLSVILGLTHMFVGLFLKGMNTVFFQKSTTFFFGFIPELMFMVSIFGYMGFLIFYKWSTNWNDNIRDPPSIIRAILMMSLEFGKAVRGGLQRKEKTDKTFTLKFFCHSIGRPNNFL